VTHDPSLAARCSRILALASGLLIADRRTEVLENTTALNEFRQRRH
jgi:predicted ABC-type transport system involved in lysophospholipase L1 biosynthesis ATPase subunit